MNPVGIEAVGWKFYIYYCFWAAVILAIVYFCFVETQGPSLEELAMIFGGPGIDRKLSIRGDVDELDGVHAGATDEEKKGPSVSHVD